MITKHSGIGVFKSAGDNHRHPMQGKMNEVMQINKVNSGAVEEIKKKVLDIKDCITRNILGKNFSTLFSATFN